MKTSKKNRMEMDTRCLRTGALAMLLAMAALLHSCTATGNATAEFWVRGNCEMCQERIEAALQAVEGVASAHYDLDAHMARVHYDSVRVKPDDLHGACASAGYETKTTPASADAYDALPKCCKKLGEM